MNLTEKMKSKTDGRSSVEPLLSLPTKTFSLFLNLMIFVKLIRRMFFQSLDCRLIKGMTIHLLRPLIIHLEVLISFFVFSNRHKTLPLIVLILSVSASAEEVNLVPCPDHTAIVIGRSNPYHGAYVRCEDFDRFNILLEQEKIEAAGRLLLTPKKPDFTRKKKPIKFRRGGECGEAIPERSVSTTGV